MSLLTIFPQVAELIEGFFNSQVTRNAANSYVSFSRDVALFLAPLFYAISFVWSYGKTTLKNAGKRPELFEREKLLRGLIIWGLIGLYIPIFGSVEFVTQKIVDATDSREYVVWREKQAQAFKESQYAEGEADGNSQSTESKAQGGEAPGAEGVGGLVGMLTGALNALFYQTIEMFAFVIKLIVVLISIILGKVFYILGPFVLLFSILPNNEDKLRKWFNTWLLLLFNPMTCNMLGGFIASLALANTDSISTGVIGDPTMISDLVLGIVIIVLYVLTFWTTSFIVGIADAGKVLSTAVSGAGMIASGGASAAAGAAGAGGSSMIPDMKKASDSAK